MSYLFNGCRALTSLDTTNFDTRNVKNIRDMFDNCRALTSLDLSNFDTTQVTNMLHMFYRLSNFNTEKISNMNKLFIYTKNLKFLNLSSFTIYDTTTIVDIFNDTNPELILCYNESKMPEHFLEKAKYYENCCRDVCIMQKLKIYS